MTGENGPMVQEGQRPFVLENYRCRHDPRGDLAE